MSNKLLERWSRLAGINVGNRSGSLLVEGGSTTYAKAVETLALLGIMKKYKNKVHPVIKTYYQTLEEDAIALYEGDIADIHKNKKLFDVTTSVAGVNNGAMPALPDPPMVVDKGRFTSEEDFRDKDGQGPGNRGFKVDLNPFQSQAVDRREAAADSPTKPDGSDKTEDELAADAAMPRYEDSTGDAGFGPSKSADAKRKGDNAALQNEKWGDDMRDAVIDAVHGACPPAPAGYELVNILQHQHGQGHPDILLIWQKKVGEYNPTGRQLLRFSSKRDEFFADEDGKLSDADIAKLKTEVQEKITGVMMWPLHVKTGDTARFSAIRSFKQYTGDAASAILGSTHAMDSLSTFLKTNVQALEDTMRADYEDDDAKKTAVEAAATQAMIDEVQEFIKEKFKYNQYKLHVDGVGPFQAGDTAASRSAAVTASFDSFDADTLMQGTGVVKRAGAGSVRIEFTFNDGTSTSKEEIVLRKRSGTGIDIEEIPTMAWENPQALAYNISQHFGTAINVEDFIKDDGQPDWVAVESLFGTPFDQVKDKSGKLVALAARKPHQNHNWFGPAVNHPAIKDAEMSLNDLLSSKKITKDWLKDLGLMERLSKYSLGHLMFETASNPFNHDEMGKMQRLARKKKLTKKKYSKVKGNRAAGYMIDNPSTAAQMEREADKDKDGIVTNYEFEEWRRTQGRKGDKRYNASEAELAAITNDVRQFQGNYVNLPAGVTGDTKMPIIDLWDNVLKPAMDKMSYSPDGKRQGAAFDKLDKHTTDRFTDAVTSTLSHHTRPKIEDNYKRKYSLAAKLLK